MSDNTNLDQIILEIIKEKNPQSVRKLTELTKERSKRPENEILQLILNLQAQGKITIEEKKTKLLNYRANKTLWFQVTIAMGAIAAFSAFLIPDNLYPWVYIRNFFGLVFVLFLPGYVFVKVFLHRDIVDKKLSEGIETIEKIALSVGLSIALISLLGLLLYYSPWGLNLETIVIAVFAVTFILGIAGVVGENRIGKTPDNLTPMQESET